MIPAKIITLNLCSDSLFNFYLLSLSLFFESVYRLILSFVFMESSIKIAAGSKIDPKITNNNKINILIKKR